MQSRVSRVSTLRLVGLAGMVFLFGGCGFGQAPTSDGLHIHGESLTADWSTHLCAAYLVADAAIAELGPSHWNTPDGTRPATVDEQTILRSGYAIYTPLQFSSLHILRDQRPEPTTEFDTIGGSLGPDSYSMGYPQVTPGGRYLLAFVPGTDPIAQAWNQKVMIAAAAYPIDEQGIVTIFPEHTEGKGNQTEQVPAVTMPYSQLIQQLTNCKAG